MALFGRGLEGDESRHVPDEFGDVRHAEEVARLDRVMRHRGVTYEQMRRDPVVRADVLHYLKVCDGIDADWAEIHRRQWADAYAESHPPHHPSRYDGVVPTSGNHDPNATVVEVAATPIRTTDGFEVKYVASVPVKLHDTSVDRAAFADRFGASATVRSSADRIAQDLLEKVDRTLADMAYVSADDATAAAQDLGESVEKAVKTPLFAVGLQLTDIVTVSADAPALRARAAEQAAVEAAKAADARADELLLRFEDIRRQNPDVPPGKLLMAQPEADRYETLRLLLEAAGKQATATLRIGAGEAIYKLSADGTFGKDAALPLEHAGPVRSLHVDEGGANDVRLLAGCRYGVTSVDVATGRTTFHRSTAASQSARGFNDCTLVADGLSRHPLIWAIHAEVGLEIWNTGDDQGAVFPPGDLRDQFEDAASRVPGSAYEVIPPSDVRATAVAANDLAAFVAVSPVDAASSDKSAASISVARATDDASSVVYADAIHYDEHAIVVCLIKRAIGGLLAVMSDGRLLSISRGEFEWEIDKRPGLFERSGNNRVIAACGVPWLGDVRVAMALEDGPVVVCGPDDDVWMEYHSDHEGFVTVAASAGRLAAVTSDRQRVVIWNLGQPERPVQDLYVLDTTRSRVADVAFL